MTHKKPFSIIPDKNNFTTYPYSDQTEGGKSKSAILKTQEFLEFEYRLDSGYTYPFAGVVIQKDSGVFDISGQDKISITISASKGKNFRSTLQFLFLALQIPIKYSPIGIWKTTWMYLHNLPLTT